MALFRLEEFNPYYREELFDGEDIKGIAVFAAGSAARIGRIDDALVDSAGRPQYFVVETGFWIFGKKVLLPIKHCLVDAETERVYALGLENKHQAEYLPEYDDKMSLDSRYENQVKRIYRLLTAQFAADLDQPSSGSDPASLAVFEPPQPKLDWSISDQTTSAGNDTCDAPAESQKTIKREELFRLYQERLIQAKVEQAADETEGVPAATPDKAQQSNSNQALSCAADAEPHQVTLLLNELQNSKIAAINWPASDVDASNLTGEPLQITKCDRTVINEDGRWQTEQPISSPDKAMPDPEARDPMIRSS